MTNDKGKSFFFSNIWTYWPSHKARIEKWLERVAIVGGKILLEFYNGHSSYYMLLSFLEASIFIKSYRRLHATRFYCVQSPFSKYSLSNGEVYVLQLAFRSPRYSNRGIILQQYSIIIILFFCFNDFFYLWEFLSLDWIKFLLFKLLITLYPRFS